MTDRIHGKPMDVATFKKPVLSDIRGHLDKMCSIIEYLKNNETSIEQNVCYICGGTEREALAEIHGFRYFTCSGCKHVYTSRRYSDDAIRRFYETNAYWAEVTYANKETCQYRRQHVALPKVEFAERYLTRKDGLWIDIGAGIGDLVSVASERGHQAVGLELSTTSVAFAKEEFGVDLVRKTMHEYVADNPGVVGTVSVVSTIGLLEHVVAPLDVLRAAHSILEPGGIVMIQVPNAGSLATMVQECFPENVFRHMSPIEHIMVFTEPSLNAALSRTGFEPVAYWFHGLDVYELMTNLILVNPRIQSSRLHGTILSLMNDLQQVIDNRELGDRIICIARKNG